jgi:integrase
VQAFVQAPARRRGRGDTVVESPATPATIARRTAVLSSFYRFAAKQVVGYDAAGRPLPLSTYNPAAAVDRPRVDPYRRVRGLGQQQTRRLLAAIPRDTPLGLRDYALLSMYLYTGRRREEIIALRWQDIERKRQVSVQGEQREQPAGYPWSEERGDGECPARTALPPPRPR